jgi:hypothetical protein
VVEHAGSPAGGFIAAQRYKAGMPEERIIVAVGDVGIGIRESLRPRYGDMTDGQAIRRAIQWHVSRIPDEAVATLIAPKLLSSRHQAQELTASLAQDLSDTVVMVDCSALQASTPSFVDELVKAVLVDRGGDRLIIKGAPERTVELARRAAQNRGVLDRLETG